MHSSRTRTKIPRGVWLGVVAMLALAPAAPVFAQAHCIEWTRTLVDTTYTCVTEPWIERVSDADTFRWKNHDYLILDLGNELSIWNIDNPSAPTFVDESRFRLGNRGDSDYDLLGFNVCDDCRFGVFTHKLAGTVLFDLGDGSVPTFYTHRAYETDESESGGAVFSKGTPGTSGFQQYLLAIALPNNCPEGETIYTIEGVNTLEKIGCLTDPSGVPSNSGTLYPIEANNTDYLLFGAGARMAFLAELVGSGSDLTINSIKWIEGLEMRGSFFSLDPKKKLAASADVSTGDVSFWDLSDPLNPKKKSWTVPGDERYNVVSLRSPTANGPAVLFLDKKGYFNVTRTYMVEASGPREFENEYWTDLDLPHNEWTPCVFNSGGTLMPDGSALFLSRSAIGQVHDLDECLDPEPAIADVTASPSSAFPGQQVTVADNTDGSYDQWAVWVTKEPGGSMVDSNPDGETTPAYGNPHSVKFTVDPAVAEGVSYTGHIAVDHTTLTPQKATDTVAIAVDRDPRASVTISPEAYIINDTITVTAAAEASSAVASYNWTITPPISPPYTDTGNPIQIDLDEGVLGTPWTAVLRVEYQHGVPSGITTDGDDRYGDLDGDGLYEFETTLSIPVSSVGAAFYVSPSSPYHNDAIDLRSTSVAATSQPLTFNWDVLNQSGTTVVNSLSWCDGLGDVDAQCRIPSETLNPGPYTFRLVIDNGTESSTATRSLTVRDGNIQVDFSYSPTSPEIGESMTFTINGANTSVGAEWDFGDSGCDGASRYYNCTPLFSSCLGTTFSYADSGSKSVTLTVRDENGTQLGEPVTHSFTVQNTGSCEEEPPDEEPCTYSLAPNYMSVGPNPADKTRSFTVSTAPKCDWTAKSNHSWLRITSGASDTGTGTVHFEFDANSGDTRNGSITVAGKEIFTITQDHAAVDYYVNASNRFPEIGEVVTFNAHPYLTVASWDFGGKNCKDQDPKVSCFGACNNMSWTYRSDGDKVVTIRFVGISEPVTKLITVKKKGECCKVDGAPTTEILSDAKGDTAYVGQTVSFSDAFAKASALKIGTPTITWSPTVPEIGQKVKFELTGITGDVQAEWDFGGPGCEGDQNYSCTPLFSDCHNAEFKYSESGEVTVSVTVTDESGSKTDEVTLTVADTGSCGGGGGPVDPVCSYSLNPTEEDFTNVGGDGAFYVYTTTDCGWTATSTDGWLSFEPTSGTGTALISYTVDPNGETDPREGSITVEGKKFDVYQSADPGDVFADDWHWEITLIKDNDQGVTEETVVYESTESEPAIDYRFTETGMYEIRLWASNCAGGDLDKQTLTVVEAPIEDFVVSSAVTLPGSNGTQWESDFRFYNPCEDMLDVTLEYQPQGTTNTGQDLLTYGFQLEPNQTQVFANLKEAIPDLQGDELAGSIRIMSSSASGCKVVSVSRTFNDTAEGPLGLTVPALPVLPTEAEAFHLTGLVSNEQYRTNVRLVNYGDKDAWVKLKLFDKTGEPVGDDKNPIKVKGHSTRQVNDVTTWMGLGVDEDLAPFTVRAEIVSGWVEAFGTVTDNVSGDSVLFMSSSGLQDKLWLPGVIHMGGVGGAFWMTDLWMHNPTEDPWLAAEAVAIAGGKPENRAPMNLAAIKSGAVKEMLDVAAEFVAPGDEVSGYIVFTGIDGDSAPQVAARTYTSDGEGGTYGINVRPYTADDLLWPGEKGYIAGIANSADLSTGYRTNLGLLNTDTTRGAKVKITVLNLDGSLAAEPVEVFVNKEKLIQFDLFAKLGIKHVTMVGSVEVEVLNGTGGFAVYCTEISNLSQDSIFIPAQRALFGVPAPPAAE